MEVKDITNSTKNKFIIIRASELDKEFLKEHNLSPTKIFNKGLEEMERKIKEQLE